LISVPRIFELIYGRIHDQVRRRGRIAHRLFDLAVNVGWREFEHRNGRAGWHPSLLLYPLLQKKVGNTLLARFGGRMRACISGGAALSTEVSRLFLALGLPIIQGYGLTEHSPVISVNRLEKNDPASVGPAVPGVEVKLGDNDELLARSPALMQGYWNNPEATAAIIDADGWLHTGDRARFDDGFIYITGRIKEILVLSNGEKVPPNDMELAIVVDPLFDQVLVVGEGRPNLTALVVLNPENWRALATKLKLAPDAAGSLSAPTLKRYLRKHIAGLTKAFPGYAQIRDVAATLEPWTVDNGLLTATLKMRRNRILEKHHDDIEAMYKRR
jgi:long-chain acyl-CoA synthetase